MTRALPKSIKGWTCFVDGYGMAGRCTSGKLPVIKTKTESHRDGGMDGEDDLEFGLEKLEAEYGFAELDRIVLGAVGSRDKPITLRGSMEAEDGITKIPVIANIRGLVTEADPGEWGGDPKKSEVKLKQTAAYYRLTIGGVEVYEIDIIGGVRRINGVDQLALRRANLGL